jgi:hypothetical protein
VERQVAPAVAVLASLEDRAHALYYSLKMRQWPTPMEL